MRVPNPVFRDWLGKHYAGLISEALTELGQERVIQFVTDAAPEPPAPALTPDELEQATDSVPAPITGSSGLNARYTFDTFIVGSSNQFAHAACTGRGRGALTLLQPTLHLRGSGYWQDPPDACHRPHVLEAHRGRALTSSPPKNSPTK